MRGQCTANDLPSFGGSSVAVNTDLAGCSILAVGVANGRPECGSEG